MTSESEQRTDLRDESRRLPPAGDRAVARPTTARRAMLVGLLLVALLVVSAALLPGKLRILVVAVAFAAGVAWERYRQGHLRRSVLAGAPESWWSTLRESVGVPYVVAAAALAAGAVGVLVLPGLDGCGGSNPAQRSASPVGPVKLPKVETRKRTLGRTFVVDKASFQVFIAGDQLWATQIRRQSAGRGQRWVTVGIDSRNIGRRRFNPNTLSHRLKDSRGTQYFPDVRGGTGPASLSKKGSLKRGETAQTRLGFRVPKSSRRLSLVFEPRIGSSLQIRVPLGKL